METHEHRLALRALEAIGSAARRCTCEGRPEMSYAETVLRFLVLHNPGKPVRSHEQRMLSQIMGKLRRARKHCRCEASGKFHRAETTLTTVLIHTGTRLDTPRDFPALRSRPPGA